MLQMEPLIIRQEPKFHTGDYYTSRMSFDGNNTAYCVEPLKKTPASGNILITFWEKISPLRKALYYVNGGYGYEKVIKDQYFKDGPMTILMSLVIWSFPISMQEIMGTPVPSMVHLKIILTKHWKLPTPLKGFLPHQNPSVLLSFLAMLPKLLQEAGIRFQTALSNCRNPLPIPIFPIKWQLLFRRSQIRNLQRGRTGRNSCYR